MKNNLYNYLIISLLAIVFASCEEDTIESSDVGKITGTVVLKGSNLPVENAKISTNPSTSTVFTSANGNFELLDVPVGDYSVQAQKDSLATKFEGATVVANIGVNVIFEMQEKSVLTDPPSAPTPLSPADGAENIQNPVEFVWNSSSTEDNAESIKYTLEIRNQANENIMQIENIQDTTYTVENLEFDKHYFWQVSASDDVNEKVWSEVFSFKTEDFPQIQRLFTRNMAGNNVIFALSENGDEIMLTSPENNSFRPRRSTAIDKIAFLQSVGAQTHLFTMDVNGANPTQVSSIPVAGFNLDMVDFSWSDNGNNLVYPNFSKLYKINATGGGTQVIYQTTDASIITEVSVYENDINKIALITNNYSGYQARIFVINAANGNTTKVIQENLPGAVGGLEFSPGGTKLLYTRDTEGFENQNYRQLDSHILLYNLDTDIISDLSQDKQDGTNDLDPRFSPTGAEIIFVNGGNNLNSPKAIYIDDVNQSNNTERLLLAENAIMPDWE